MRTTLTQALRDKLVLVGTTALGTREVVATPFDTQFVGVEVQATVADNLLQGDFIHRLEHQRAIESGATLATGCVVAMLMAGRGLTLGTAFASAVLGTLWLVGVWLFASRGLYVSPLFPTLGWIAAFSAVSFARFRLSTPSFA